MLESTTAPKTLISATRERERRMRAFRDTERMQSFLSSFGTIRQHSALKRHLLRASLYRTQLGERFAWHRFTELAQIHLFSRQGRVPCVCRAMNHST